jgi:hypothetical protein
LFLIHYDCERDVTCKNPGITLELYFFKTNYNFMTQISTIEDIKATIMYLDRHLNTLNQWHFVEKDPRNSRIIRESAGLHAAMRFYCYQLLAVLQNEQFKAFDRKYLQSAEHIPAINFPDVISPEDNPGIQDCSGKLIEICHYALALRQLYEQKKTAEASHYQQQAAYAAQLEKIAVYAIMGLTMLVVCLILLVQMEFLALAAITPFLLYFFIPVILVAGCVMLPLIVEFGSSTSSFEQEAAELASGLPIVFQNWGEVDVAIEKESAQKIKGLYESREARRLQNLKSACRNRTREDIMQEISGEVTESLIYPPVAITSEGMPSSASDFGFFHYSHPSNLADNPPAVRPVF